MTLALAIVAIVFSALAILVSAWQLREARKANTFPGAVDLFREYRSPEMIRARRKVLRIFPDLPLPPDGFQGLDDDVADPALRVSHYLDNLGVLIDRRLLDPELVDAFLGNSALDLWAVLERFIYREREERQGPYQQYSELLVSTLEEIRFQG